MELWAWMMPPCRADSSETPGARAPQQQLADGKHPRAKLAALLRVGDCVRQCVALLCVPRRVHAGHGDARWLEAVTEQAATLTHVSNLFHTVPQVGGCCRGSVPCPPPDPPMSPPPLTHAPTHLWICHPR